jgi:HSP20 family molecular chaperone IbpA
MSTVNENVCTTDKPADAVDSACRGKCYAPAADVFETAHELTLLADVPGATTDQIDVRFEDGELRIHAPVGPRRKDNPSYLLEEYGVGDYYRSFRLGQEIDASKIEASLRDGVLRLHIPKAEEARPRRIEVKVG